MSKVLRILETPILLLVIALACHELEAGGTAIFLTLVSIVKLITNVITDEFIYKK
tara:strand:+ start:737 stop:901 length:165 start_codon:yes stop_codon:yes gene_type:complete